MSKLTCVVLVVTIVAGCKSEPAAPNSKPRVTNTSRASAAPTEPRFDTGGCEERLHDISGLFLLYSQQKKRLPASLDDLRSLPGAPDLMCPVSQQPYIYDRDGIPVPSGSGRVILYDASPVHRGFRMCVVITEAGAGSALVTRVIALPDSFFQPK